MATKKKTAALEPATVADVRNWGRANGFEVKDRGRLPQSLTSAFTEKTGQPIIAA